MREIKFRAYSPRYKEMCEVNVLDTSDDLVIVCWSHKSDSNFISNNIENSFRGISEDSDEDKDLILMQYTGLRDRDGNEIFEEDLIKFSGDNLIYQVVWTMGAFQAVPIEPSLQFLSSSQKWKGVGYTDSCVIGNIYENPELLENDRT